MARRTRRRAAATAALALALALGVLPALALEHGRVSRRELYTAPDRLSTVRSPLGPNPGVIDSFDHSAGAVTFVDEAGGLYWRYLHAELRRCSPACSATMPRRISRSCATGCTTRPFRSSSSASSRVPSIVQEGAATFEGRPAWIGVMQLPHGSALFGTTRRRACRCAGTHSAGWSSSAATTTPT